MPRDNLVNPFFTSHVKLAYYAAPKHQSKITLTSSLTDSTSSDGNGGDGAAGEGGKVGSRRAQEDGGSRGRKVDLAPKFQIISQSKSCIASLLHPAVLHQSWRFCVYFCQKFLLPFFLA